LQIKENSAGFEHISNGFTDSTFWQNFIDMLFHPLLQLERFSFSTNNPVQLTFRLLKT
jgi:hypothetical protein